MLHAPREAEAEPADPAAADGVLRGVAALDGGLLVEQRERVLARGGDPDRRRAEDRAAPGPATGEREGPLVAAEGERRPPGVDGDLVQRGPPQPRGAHQ